VDPHRSLPDDYGKDPDHRWFSGDRTYSDGDWARPGSDYRHAADDDTEDRYQVPEPRSAGGAEPAGASRYADLIPSEPYPRDQPDPRGPGAPVIGARSGELLPPLPDRPPVAAGPGRGPGPGPSAAPYPPPAPPDPAPADNPPSGGLLDDVLRHNTEPIDRTALRRPGGPSQIGEGVYRSRRPALLAMLIIGAVLLEVAPLRILVAALVHAQANATVSATLLVVGLPIFAYGMYALLSGVSTVQASQRAWLRSPLVYLPVGLILFVAAALAA